MTMTSQVPGIRATFPLGVYRGHRPDGTPDPLPSPLRLHAALVAAACNGSTAEPHRGSLHRTAPANQALEWLEDNPPDFIELPPWQATTINRFAPFAFRDEGVVENVRTSPNRRKTQRHVSDGTSLAGAIGWGWQQIPAKIAETLAVLCEDVPCLGEADSPVVLEVDSLTPTHRRSRNRSPFASVAITLRTPLNGRLAELDKQHSAAHPSRPPTVAADKWKATEQPSPSPISHVQSVAIGYEPIDAPPPQPGPWEWVIHISTSTSIDQLDRVAWSVALHRALASVLGDDAPSVITGKYNDGTAPLANRLAIQPIDAGIAAVSRHPELGEGLALLVPDGHLHDVAAAVKSVSRLYRRETEPIKLGEMRTVRAAEFWSDAPPGMVRLWSAVPAVVPETRRQRGRGRNWNLSDSALLSLAFTFRNHLTPQPDASATAAERYVSLVEAVTERGVHVLSASPIPDVNVRRYAHKLPEGLIAQPYRLLLHGGNLIPDNSIVAIGQSRHLGGGLLCPVDVPDAVAAAWGVTS